tara:strand:+ start:28290 stop:29180 length:891 start_codon:yes stop_codon:yes gene_type:complete
MRSYLDIVENVLSVGRQKENRTGIKSYTTFCEIFRHNMSDGFPLLTTKKMPYRTIAIELEGFIKGITDKGWFQERGCKIWNEWANPKAVEFSHGGVIEMLSNEEFRKKAQLYENDLGPIYGYQWRAWNQDYGDMVGERQGIDQLRNVIETLKNNPDDRRMVVSAWNPSQMHLMALPPCHYAFTLVHIDGVLNLCWKQRSADLMLGVPFNIASYGLLLELICKEVGMIAGELVGILEDCHIYENHMEGAKKQLERKPEKLPSLLLSEPYNIYEWTYEDFDIVDYNSDKRIDFGQVAV